MNRMLVILCLAGAVLAQDADSERLKLIRVGIEAKLKVGDLLREQGKLPEAMAAYREAIAMFNAANRKRIIGRRIVRAPAVVRGKITARFADRAVTRVETQGSIKRALQWLSTHQNRDGRWDSDDWMRHDPVELKGLGAGGKFFDVGVTSLALMAFLQAGHGDKNNPYADNVARGLKFLMDRQDKDGCFGGRASQHFIYNTILATNALCDGLRVSKNPAYRAAAQRGLDWLARARNPYLAWRYGVRSGENDTSVTAVAIQALVAGKKAQLKVDPDCLRGARAWVDKMTDLNFGQVGYNYPGGSAARPEGLQDKYPPERTQAMTAAGLFIRIVSGEDPRSSDAIRKGAALCSELQPAWDDRGFIDMYYWYFGTKSLFQIGGNRWRNWQASLRNNVVSGQSKDGSWSPIGPWGLDGGRVYSTAVCALTLQETMRPDSARAFPVR